MSYLDEIFDPLDVEARLRDEEEERRSIRRSIRESRLSQQVDAKNRYDAARQAKVGEMIACPGCGTVIKKTTYHKVFCTNRKTSKRRDKKNCKDRYWNLVRM